MRKVFIKLLQLVGVQSNNVRHFVTSVTISLMTSIVLTLTSG